MKKILSIFLCLQLLFVGALYNRYVSALNEETSSEETVEEVAGEIVEPKETALKETEEEFVEATTAETLVEENVNEDSTVDHSAANEEELVGKEAILTVSNEKFFAYGIIQVELKDEEGHPIEEATFELHKRNAEGRYDFIEGLDTNEYGLLSFTSLEVGSYRIKQRFTPEKYLLNENPDVDVELNETNSPYTVNVINRLKKITISFTKVDSNEPEKKLGGAKFGLRTASDQPFLYTATSGQDGRLVFRDVVPNYYEVVEMTPPEGYLNEFPDGVIFSTYFTSDRDLGDVKNTATTGHVRIFKVDKDNRDIYLKGAKLGLSSNGKIIQQQVTSADGLAVFKNVPVGVYQVVEIEAPIGYQKSNEQVTVEIEPTTMVDTDYFFNQKLATTQLGSITFKSLHKDTGAPVVGSKFVLVKHGEERYIAESKNDGTVSFPGVLPGSYQLKMKSAPDSYLLNIEVRDIEVVANQQNDLAPYKIEPEAPVLKGAYSFKVVDADEQTLGLRDATFVLKKGNEIIAQATSNLIGLVRFKDVPYGTYDLSQTTTQSGYLVSDEIRSVTIASSGSYGNSVTNRKVLNDKGSILVTVYDNETHQRLPNVRVKLSQNSAFETKETGPDGRVVFSNLTFGLYTISLDGDYDGYLPWTKSLNVNVTNAIENNVSIDLEKIKGSIAFEKVDKEDVMMKLANATFVLKQNNQIKYRATSTASGEVLFNQVELGTYTLQEEVAPSGYQLSKETREVTLISTLPNVSIDPFVNEKEVVVPLKGTLRVLKVDASDPTSLLQGVEFELKKDGHVVKQGVTNHLGLVMFEQLDYGNYELVEVKTLDKYVLDPMPHPVEINEENQEMIIQNKQKTGHIYFYKVDRDNHNIKLQHATFILEQNGVAVYMAVSDEQGYVSFKDVKLGQYKLKETIAPNGYVLDDTPTEIGVRADQLDHNLEYMENVKKSTAQFAEVSFKKVDFDDSTIPLADAEFGLFQNDELKYTAKSNALGEVLFPQVVYGTYILKETKAPLHYQLSTQTISVEANKPKVIVNDFKNQKQVIQKGSIRFVKVDEQEPTKTLKGATFALEDEQGVVKTVTTLEDGVVVFDNLELKNYTVKETKAPDGYEITTQAIPVALTSANPDKDLQTITNRKLGVVHDGHIAIVLVDQEDPSKGIADATFSIISNGIEKQGTTDASGRVEFTSLFYGDWEVRQVDTPLRYQVNSAMQVIHVGDGVVKEVNVTNALKRKSIRVDVVWQNAPANHPDVWFKLYSATNNQPESEVPQPILKLMPGSSFVEWQLLPQYDERNQEIQYSIKQVDQTGQVLVLQEYQTNIQG
ncbi:MAG: SpaA isopeptide-forming pilin-related protein, partial [Erysipelotrichaceae bacterium]|nr:SpaA isopeptide-forming pilin-related protein [Erysipelotrichaceae bacterium]